MATRIFPNFFNKIQTNPTGSLSGFNNADFKKVAQDSLKGRKSAGRLVPLQYMLNAHIDENFTNRKEIAPGVFSTGFSDRVKLASVDAVLPDTFERHEISVGIKEILENIVLHTKNPKAPLSCNTSTLDDVLKGNPPSLNRSDIPLDVPLFGKDGHGNRVFIMQAGHPAAEQVGEMLDYGKLTAKAGGTCSWQNAAWLSTLWQVKPDDLKKTLESKHIDKAVVERITILSKALYKKPSFDPVMRVRSQHADSKGSLQLHYPEGMGLDDQDCEKDLAQAMHNLAEHDRDFSNKSIGKEMADESVDKYAAHVFSLTRLMGAKSVVIGDPEKNEDGLRSIAVSGSDTKDVAGMVAALSQSPLLMQVGKFYVVSHPEDLMSPEPEPTESEPLSQPASQSPTAPTIRLNQMLHKLGRALDSAT